MDSPANSPPIPTPYNPPISSSSSHTSTECAHPSVCNTPYAVWISLVIHPPGLRCDAHADTTASNAELKVQRNLAWDFRSDLEICKPLSGNMPRITGLHHPSCLRCGIGKQPARYAARMVPGSKSAPTATRSLDACCTSGNTHWLAGGSTGAREVPALSSKEFRDRVPPWSEECVHLRRAAACPQWTHPILQDRP